MRPDHDMDRLRRSGVVATSSRRLVLVALGDAATPLSANDVYDALRGSHARVALTTVYRVLHLLARHGIVHAFAGAEQRYRLCSPEPHLHLVCESCQDVVEQPVPAVMDWLDGLGAHGFDIDLQRTTVYGLCIRCRVVVAVGRSENTARISQPCD